MRTLQSPNCPWPPVCFLCRPCAFGLSANGFAIRHLRRLQRHLGVITLLQPRHDRLNVRLPRTGNQKFIRLRIAEEPNQQVFFHQLVNRRRELVFIGAALGLNGVSHGRLRQRRQIHLNIPALRSQRVAGQRIAQLGNSAQIAGMQFSYFNGLSPLHRAQVREALLSAPRVVLERRIVLDHAADHLEEADAP